MLSPVVEFETVAKALDAFVVSLVAGHEGKAVLEGDGRDDGIGTANRLPGALRSA